MGHRKGFVRLPTPDGRNQKSSRFTDGWYEVHALPRNILCASHCSGGRQFIGVFSLQGESSLVPLDAQDGSYINLIDGSSVEVFAGKLTCKGKPIILKID